MILNTVVKVIIKLLNKLYNLLLMLSIKEENNEKDKITNNRSLVAFLLFISNFTDIVTWYHQLLRSRQRSILSA